MDRDELAGYLAEGLSLERIGALVGKHPSTVGYWVKRHGLRAAHRERHAPRGGISEEGLRALVAAGLTGRAIAEELGVSLGTVRYWLKRYGLTTATARRDRQLRGKYAQAHCRRHGPARFVLEGRGYYRCTLCRKERVSERRRRVKVTLVAEAGGRCALCGYDRYVGALHFHHVDPDTKRFGLARGGVTLGIERLRAEARKCVLLCSNCHAELGGGLISTNLVEQVKERVG